MLGQGGMRITAHISLSSYCESLNKCLNEIVQIFLDYSRNGKNIDLNAKADDGKTAFMIACGAYSLSLKLVCLDMFGNLAGWHGGCWKKV